DAAADGPMLPPDAPDPPVRLTDLPWFTSAPVEAGELALGVHKLQWSAHDLTLDGQTVVDALDAVVPGRARWRDKHVLVVELRFHAGHGPDDSLFIVSRSGAEQLTGL